MMPGMTQEQTPAPPTPPAPEGVRLTLLDVSGLLAAVEVAAAALEGDGSTSTMPDVTPDQAARWMVAALDAAGYIIARRVPQ